MSDFELFMMVSETWDDMITTFSIFLSIVFAFLVASAVIADRLSRLLAGIIVALFTITSITFVVMTWLLSQAMKNMTSHVASAVADGSSGLGFWVTDTTAWSGFTPQQLVPWIMLLSFVASLTFFIYRRGLERPK